MKIKILSSKRKHIVIKKVEQEEESNIKLSNQLYTLIKSKQPNSSSYQIAPEGIKKVGTINKDSKKCM